VSSRVVSLVAHEASSCIERGDRRSGGSEADCVASSQRDQLGRHVGGLFQRAAGAPAAQRACTAGVASIIIMNVRPLEEASRAKKGKTCES